MAEITAALVKELRERTGQGMMECKKALVAAGGDIEKAIDDMRASGAIKAAKKAGNVAAEGAIAARVEGGRGLLIEVNSQTDFLALQDDFKAFVKESLDEAFAQKLTEAAPLIASRESAREALVAKCGENVNIRRLARAEGDVVGAYLHGHRIGVLVVLKGGNEELAKHVAMHVAASNPAVLSPSDVSEELIAKEKEIFLQLNAEKIAGKPENIVENMVKGRIAKFLAEASLVEQPFVKDPEVISTITYRELRELSYMGATVLHEDSIFPLRQEGIPIHVLNTNAPQDPGTMIVENTCSKPKFTITGIAGKKGFASITVEKSMMNTEIGFGRKVLGVFEDNNLSFEHMPSGIDTMTVFVHQNEFAEKEQQVIAGLHRAVQPDSIDLESDLALIAVVGRGMRRTRGTAGRIFSALAHAHVNVKMIDQGSSELNIIIGVENRDFETAIKAIYDIFVVAQI